MIQGLNITAIEKNISNNHQAEILFKYQNSFYLEINITKFFQLLKLKYYYICSRINSAMIAHTFNPSTHEAEAEAGDVCEFKVSLVHSEF